MAGSGLDTQFGFKAETVYGTPVVVDRFLPILNESLARQQTVLQSQGLRASGRNPRRRGVISSRSGAGDVALEIGTTGFGVLINHLTGGTSSIAQQGGTAAYLQTHQLGDLEGLSLTMQKGVAQTDGTVKPFTFHGCKLLSGTFSISVDQIAQLSVSVDAEDVETSTALASASYGTQKLFHFMHGELKVAGSSVAAVTNAEITLTNNLKTDRFYLGSAGLKQEPIDNDFPEITGTLDAEFVDQADFYDRYQDDDAVALVLEFVGDNIASTYDETLRITVPEVRFTGDTPSVGGPEVVVQNVTFDGHYDGTNAGLKVEIISTDTAI